MNGRLLPAFALFVAIGILFGYVSPAWSGEIVTMRAAIASDDQALAAATSYKEHESQLASAKNAIDSASLGRLATFLPDSVDNVSLILDLNALAARSGLALSNIDVAADLGAAAKAAQQNAAPAGLSSLVGSVDLSLSAVGTYTALQNFLKGVERSGRLLDVRDISVKGSNTGAYAYQMTIRLYWLR